MLHATQPTRPNVRQLTRADDLLLRTDAFLVDGAELEHEAIRLAVMNPQKRNNRPVMLLLAPTQVEQFAMLAERAKNVDFIVKPVSERALTARIERLLSRSGKARPAGATASGLERISQHDEATDLPSRNLFEAQLDAALWNADETKRRVCVLAVHPQLPEHVGADPALRGRYLRLFGERLTADVRSGHTASALTATRLESATATATRLEGEKFVILLDHISKDDALGRIARGLQAELSRPLTVGGVNLILAPRVGVSIYPEDANTASGLIAKAQCAAEYAKREARAPVQRYQPCMDAALPDRHEIECRLRHAVSQTSFDLAYQPRIEVTSGRCTGFEALIRWTDDQLGSVSPGEFIPIAEELGLMTDITEWVIDTACQQIAAWRVAKLAPVKVSLNLSGQDLQSPGLGDYIEDRLATYGVPASAIELEITEGVLMENLELSTRLLERLHEIGLSIALDDFGTGYSSLAYLDRMPIDTLKLDRSFIQQIMNNWSSAAITSCVITLAQVLGLRVVAEGVETQTQFDTLKEQDCDEIQGRLFSMPLTPEVASGWLERP